MSPLARLDRFAVRFRWLVVLFWLLLAGGLFLAAPRLSDVTAYSSQGFLPDSAPSKQAEKLLAAIRQPTAGQTSLALVLSRQGGLTADDEAAGSQLAQAIAGKAAAWKVVSVEHPWLSPAHRAQMLSANGRSAIIAINLDESAYSNQVAALVDGIRAWVAGGADRPPLPAGLQANLTGESAFSRDEHRLVNESMDRITQITVVVVLLVLVLVFRSPVAPLLPLSVVGLSFLVSKSIVALMTLGGFVVSSYTETFLIAVLFGAGTDYALLMVSRYREELGHGKTSAEALALAQRWSGPAILSSGGTVVIGFLCMGLAGFGLYNSTGPSVAIGVAVAILMVLTLTPALISWIGPRIFWPRKPESLLKPVPHDERGRFWDRLAGFVTRRPAVVLISVCVVALPFILASLASERSFDQLSELPLEADSMAGFTRITEDFSVGEAMPLRLVVAADKDMWGNRQLQALEQAALELSAKPEVAKVRGPTRPTGVRIDLMKPDGSLPSAEELAAAKPFSLPKLAIAAQPELKAAMERSIAPDGRSAYLEVVLKESPYRLEALAEAGKLRAALSDALVGTSLEGARVEAAGATAMFADVEAMTAADFIVVAVIVLGGIFVVLALLLRSLVAPLYLLATIIASYAVTMGATSLVFEGLLGYEGVNWAVGFFAFCVLVALGVDYNIFLMSRVREEYRPGHTKRAVALALAETGKIITSCGIIMAGCFCAMMVSPVRSIIEVGFATVLGLLIDTFIVRTLAVPAIATLVGEANWWPGSRRGKA